MENEDGWLIRRRKVVNTQRRRPNMFNPISWNSIFILFLKRKILYQLSPKELLKSEPQRDKKNGY